MSRNASLFPESTPDAFFKAVEVAGVESIHGKDCYKVEHNVKIGDADFATPEALKEALESDKKAPAKDDKKPDTK